MTNKTINNYKINAFKSKDDFLNQIKDEKKILIAMNAEKILKKDDRLREIINNNIGYPDGVGAVMALKQKGLNAIKIPGSEFWLNIISTFHKEKSFYLLGTTTDVIENTVLKLKEEFPSINIVGYRDGFLKDDDKEKLKETLVTLKPDVVFVAQGSPRQEFLMDELIKIHPALYMGLGGSFDLYTGITKPVPDWWKKIFKWEGLYRSLNDISNLSRWKRQLTFFKFLYALYLKKL
jgi:UDP-N-acetyl-D-mannosaminouronate:lipid I N-acetyl-D-mannosaminouronosyltransferase